jgi:hypothetical protein
MVVRKNDCQALQLTEKLAHQAKLLQHLESELTGKVRVVVEVQAKLSDGRVSGSGICDWHG